MLSRVRNSVMQEGGELVSRAGAFDLALMRSKSDGANYVLLVFVTTPQRQIAFSAAEARELAHAFSDLADRASDPIDTCDDCGNRLEEGEVGLCQCCEQDRAEREPQDGDEWSGGFAENH